MKIEAREIWKQDRHNQHQVVIQVRSDKCSYQVGLDFVEETAVITAPGLKVEREIGPDVPDDEEAYAIALVAMIEGGIEL